MSPEELLATVSLNSIDTFKQMDVYSMALVLWEVMSQCDVTGTITFAIQSGNTSPKPTMRSTRKGSRSVTRRSCGHQKKYQGVVHPHQTLE